MPLSNLLVAAVVATSSAGTALAQQLPSGNGRDFNGPIAILKNIAGEPDGVTVYLNGTAIDHLRAAGYSDITGVVHGGSNKLTVSWARSLRQLNFSVSYAPTRNNFKKLLVVNADADHNPGLASRLADFHLCPPTLTPRASPAAEAGMGGKDYETTPRHSPAGGSEAHAGWLAGVHDVEVALILVRGSV